MSNSQTKYLNTRLVGILRTKIGTPSSNAVNAIQAAFDSGAEAVEITSNSNFWQEILSECVKRNLNIGVGSIKTRKLAEEAISLGARFLVSPGFFEDAIEVANQSKIPILPGVFTAPNFKQAVDLNIADVKFFPANASTHEELFKAIREPFRDEFDELTKLGWDVIASPHASLGVNSAKQSRTINDRDCFVADAPRNDMLDLGFGSNRIVQSPTQFYKLYLEVRNKKPDNKIVIELPDEKQGLDRLKDFAKGLSEHGIRTYAVGGINDKNMKDVLTKYGAYGVCPGSGMFNGDAIFEGDFERVKTDVKRHVDVIKSIGLEV